jgi:pre-mRNA-splicing factor ATP-dependent RNA helicase DHX38/PRP16
VTAVEPEWLAELGPMFFSIKESHAGRLLQKKKQREAEAAMAAEAEAKEAAEAVLRAAEEEARKRALQRDTIATPGRDGGRRLTTPRRHIGL